MNSFNESFFYFIVASPRPTIAAKTPQVIPRQIIQPATGSNQKYLAPVLRSTPLQTPVNPNRSLMRPPQSVGMMGTPVPSPRNQLAQFNNNNIIQRSGQSKTPFPIIDFNNKGVLEKMVDYLIGDGPSNRFAMICKQCNKHNGMAFEEEFYYSTFNCAYCNTVNPARKLRPVAPKLHLPTVSATNSDREQNKNSTSSSSSSSDSEREGEFSFL